MRRIRAGTLTGMICIVLALLVLAVWIPLDVETGLTEKMRRQVRIGDAMLPTLASAIVLLGGLMLLLPGKGGGPGLTGRNLAFLAAALGVIALSLAAMRWLGPLAAALTETGYRPLRDTPPWKWIGFLAGGTALVSGLMALVEGRLSARGLIAGLAASAALIVLFDLPFEDLLLPPNGDV